MDVFSPEEREARKKAIWDKMSPRRRKFVNKIGYENWDPFQEPLHPIDIRREDTGSTAQELVREFVKSLDHPPHPDFVQSVQDFAVVLLHNKERVKPIFQFCKWYSKRMEKQGKTL